MLSLSDFVTYRKKYYNQSRGVYISALENCRNIPSADIYKQNFLCCHG